MRPSFKKKSLPARPRHAEFGEKSLKKNPSRRAPVMLNLVKNHHFWGALVMRTSVKKKYSISVEIPHYQRPRHANLRKKKKDPSPPSLSLKFARARCNRQQRQQQQQKVACVKQQKIHKKVACKKFPVFRYKKSVFHRPRRGRVV